MTRSTALDLIRRIDLNATLLAAHRDQTLVDLGHSAELFATARAEDRAARRAPTGPGPAGAAAKTAGRPGAQPRRRGGVS